MSTPIFRQARNDDKNLEAIADGYKTKIDHEYSEIDYSNQLRYTIGIMSNYDSDEHSRRTYKAAKNYILADPKDPMGKGMAKQLVTEAVKLPFKIMGLGLLVLSNALKKTPDQIDKAHDILKE